MFCYTVWKAETERRKILTADLQKCRLIVLSDGTACWTQVLTSVWVLDILQSEGGHAGVTPHHDISIQALNGSRKSLVLGRKKRNIEVSLFPITIMWIYTLLISAKRSVTWKGKNGETPAFNDQKRRYANDKGTVCSVEMWKHKDTVDRTGEFINNRWQKH